MVCQDHVLRRIEELAGRLFDAVIGDRGRTELVKGVEANCDLLHQFAHDPELVEKLRNELLVMHSHRLLPGDSRTNRLRRAKNYLYALDEIQNRTTRDA